MASATDREIDEATTLFHLALLAIGLEVTTDVISRWSDVPVAKKGPSTDWVGGLVDMAVDHREAVREAAIVYYRLVRALATGRTVPPLPGMSLAPSPSLNVLRREFRSSVRHHIPPATMNANQRTRPKGGDGEALPVDKLGERDRDIESEGDRVLKEYEEIASNVIDMTARMGRINEDRDAKSVDRDRARVHSSTGSSLAGVTEWLAIEAGRNVVAANLNHDSMAMGWMRISSTGTPCGFCAMLMSRGLVKSTSKHARGMYKSQESADGQFHPNCHCIAVPIFSETYLKGSPLFDLNRHYAQMWPKVTRGLSGDAALSAWRRWMRQQIKDAREASSTNSATQEVVNVSSSTGSAA